MCKIYVYIYVCVDIVIVFIIMCHGAMSKLNLCTEILKRLRSCSNIPSICGYYSFSWKTFGIERNVSSSAPVTWKFYLL